MKLLNRKPKRGPQVREWKEEDKRELDELTVEALGLQPAPSK